MTVTARCCFAGYWQKNAAEPALHAIAACIFTTICLYVVVAVKVWLHDRPEQCLKHCLLLQQAGQAVNSLTALPKPGSGQYTVYIISILLGCFSQAQILQKRATCSIDEKTTTQ